MDQMQSVTRICTETLVLFKPPCSGCQLLPKCRIILCTVDWSCWPCAPHHVTKLFLKPHLPNLSTHVSNWPHAQPFLNSLQRASLFLGIGKHQAFLIVTAVRRTMRAWLSWTSFSDNSVIPWPFHSHFKFLRIKELQFSESPRSSLCLETSVQVLTTSWVKSLNTARICVFPSHLKLALEFPNFHTLDVIFFASLHLFLFIINPI